MYAYIQTEPNLWTVGHYSPLDEWHPESDHDSPRKAANRVHYLNGGTICAVCGADADGPFYCYEHKV